MRALRFLLACLAAGCTAGYASTYNVPVHVERGGERLVIGDGGSADVESGGEIDIESGGALKIGGVVAAIDLSFTFSNSTSHVAEVTISVDDLAGNPVTAKDFALEIWLSDSATGAGLTSTTASGTVQAKSGEGSDLSAYTAKKHISGVTKNGAGIFVLEITDTSDTGFFIAVKNPLTGWVEVSRQLVAADYGS